MALAVVLLIGAALLIRSFLAVGRVTPGFDPRNVLTMRMSITGPPFADPGAVARLMHDGLRRLHALPGVEAAAAACCVPLDSRLQVGFRIDGRGPESGGVTGWVEVSAGYFETFRIPILRGRTFTESDESGSPVAIVNQALSQKFWPGVDPLNARIRLGDSEPIRIIGVAGGVRDRGLDRDTRPTLYVPSVAPGGLLRLIPWAWVVRTRGAPQSLAPAIREQLRQASGGLPVGQVRTMEEILSHSQAARKFQTVVLLIFGLSALLLAAIGICALMTHSITQRRREIGVRLALGADSRRIRKMVVSEGFRLALAGAICGLAAAWSLTRWLAAFLFSVQARDPLVFCTVPLVLSAVALAATWLPARRAAQLEPLQALRDE
jgi:predicted permease